MEAAYEGVACSRRTLGGVLVTPPLMHRYGHQKLDIYLLHSCCFKPFHMSVCIYQKNQKISSFPCFHLTFMRENKEKEKKTSRVSFWYSSVLNPILFDLCLVRSYDS